MSNRKSICLGIPVCVLWSLGTPFANAQSAESDAGELAALGGLAFGGGIGTRASATGSAGVAFSRYGMVLFDTSFIPLGQQTIQGWPPQSTVNRSYLIDFGVDVHIRIPVRPHWAPYAIAGTGLLWNLVRQDTVSPAGVAVIRHFNQFNGALHTGGGFRYYVRENWGIRPEVKVIVSKQVYTSISVGIFYVTPPYWP